MPNPNHLASPSWFDEIDLDPSVPWLRMGTRQLGDRPWLVFDDALDRELALKRKLLSERRNDVLAVDADCLVPGAEVLSLVEDEWASNPLDYGPPIDESNLQDLHPLDRAGRSVQEDLCLLRRGPSGWILAGASLCFPSRWRLSEKIGRPLDAVHEPVDGYHETLASRVDSLLDRIDSKIVWRRNWFLHPDGQLFQPDRPAGGDPLVLAKDCGTDLYLRSERQTLRRLPNSGWVLFAIKIQQATLQTFVADPVHHARLVDFLNAVEPHHAEHRGLSPAQVAELHKALQNSC